MKKIYKIAIIIFILAFSIFYIPKNVKAVSLDSIDIQLNKTKIKPGEEITVNVEFGKELGSYTFDFAYDNKLLEFVRAEGGTENDNGTRVRVYYFDATGGTNPRSNMSITFRAKSDLITANPTDISITAEGLANNDASEEYDDIGVPIVKNVVIEPEFKDYEIEFAYDGKIVKNEEKQTKLTIKSDLGKNYDHARLVAEVKTTTGGTVTLKGQDQQGIEHEIIQSGWGDASGYQIGGKNVNQELNLTALFTKEGEYVITFKLIDRDNSDSIIASKDVSIVVGKKEQVTPPQNDQNGGTTQKPDENNNSQKPEEKPEQEPDTTLPQNNENIEKLPSKLPKTGTMNIYLVIILSIILLTTIYITIKSKD